MQDKLTNEHYWAAGFIEGEGCFTCYRGRIAIVTSQKEREPLDRLQKVIGGRINQDKWRNRAPIWIHYLRPQAEVDEVIKLLYPLMSSRRQAQIDRCYAQKEAWKTDPKRLEVAAKINARNRERYRTDPEFRASRIAAHKKWRERKKSRG